MAERELSLTYSGPALEDGRMEVRDLAPALLALSEVFQEANTLTNPGSPPVGLQIRAFDKGSFEVLLNLAHKAPGLAQQVADFLASEDATALANLVAYVTGLSGLFALLRHLYKRSVSTTEQAAPGVTRFTMDDGTTLEVPSAVLLLYQQPNIRRNARDVVKPLTSDGIDDLTIQVGQQLLTIHADEAGAFNVPATEDLTITRSEMEMALTITAVSFAEGNKWRLSDGERTFFASIEDESFVARVESGEESFRNGDILRCRLRVEQWQTDTGLRTEYHVVRVLDHIPGVLTLPLPFDSDDPPPAPRAGSARPGQ